MDEIKKLREEVDKINTEIFDALSKRFKYTNEIAKIKFKNKLPLVDSDRESKMLSELLEDFYSDDNKFAILEIFTKILEESKKQQLLEVENKNGSNK